MKHWLYYILSRVKAGTPEEERNLEMAILKNKFLTTAHLQLGILYFNRKKYEIGGLEVLVAYKRPNRNILLGGDRSEFNAETLGAATCDLSLQGKWLFILWNGK